MSGRLLGELAFAQFFQRLAVDAQGGRRACFQPLDADFDAALVAVAIIVTIDAAKRFVDLLDQLALAVTVAQFEAMSVS